MTNWRRVLTIIDTFPRYSPAIEQLMNRQVPIGLK
jgi:hypothetical protein